MSKKPTSSAAKKTACIRLRGVRQNNLKNLNIDIPLGKFTVITGLSGAGKSSLAFDTLHAEGQRRYVETFSAYTRQFLELLDKPQVDNIENIRPSIAIQQSNAVKTSRSTVGTLTEITDYLKVWFSQTATLHDPDTNEPIDDDNPRTIWTKTLAKHPGKTLLLTFRITRPAKLPWAEILRSLEQKSYTRILIPTSDKSPTTHTLHRIPDLLSTLTESSEKGGARSPSAPENLSKNKRISARQGTSANASAPGPGGDDVHVVVTATAAQNPQSKIQNSPCIHVIQDRIPITPENETRFLESAEQALHFGQGELQLIDAATLRETARHSRGLHSPTSGRRFRAPTPNLFSFNSPLGACPRCRGFGRIIEIDYRLAIPDQNLSIDDGAIRPFHGEIYGLSKADLIRAARRHKIPTDIPYNQLTPAQQNFVIHGEPAYLERKARGEKPDYTDDLWYGVRGFFEWLESNTYKMHVRMVLAHYRSYNTCPDCQGARLQPESLCWKWRGHTLPQLYQLPVSDLLKLLTTPDNPPPNSDSDVPQIAKSADGAAAKGGARSPSAPENLPKTQKKSTTQSPLDNAPAPVTAGILPTDAKRHVGASLDDARDAAQLRPNRQSSIVNRISPTAHSTLDTEALRASISRLRYLEQVGLSYLSLDRSSRTLSGGEMQRVNLTSCLGTSLVDTLFILDEPSIGLHPRDIHRLIAIIRTLTDAGNTVIVVEHDETTIRAADHLIEIGPEPGARGGHLTFDGTLSQILRDKHSITGKYLSQKLRVPIRETARPIPQNHPRLHIQNATIHNLKNFSVSIPLRRLVALSGVSGSGKSTLLDNVLYQGLLAQRGQYTETPAQIKKITTDLPIDEIHLVDQTPVTRTPRSNAALYTGAWEHIRKLYADTPAAQQAGFTHSHFSFNSGDGRCPHCQGLGYERVEMQFLSDIFVPCPICETRRFKPEILAIKWQNHTIADLLATTITDALPLFQNHPKVRDPLSALVDVGLGYLTLGQPLNTLSGGEARRIKLTKFLTTTTDNPPPNSDVPQIAKSADGETAKGGARSPSAPKNLPKNQKKSTTQATPANASATSDFHSSLSTLHSSPPHHLLLIDEPSTGLHQHDIARLTTVLQRIVDAGHTIILIEHNTDLLKSADQLIEIGPEAGAAGGRLIAQAPPEQIAAQNQTPTAPYLKAENRKQRAEIKPQPALLTKSTALGRKAPSSPISTLCSQISLIGARENNLRNLTLQIPRNQLTVVTGVSGSGKSTLAFDIIFAEGQRRFMESMSPYARQFTEQLPKPDIDRLTGIPPTVAIEQRVTRGSRKSTVATITEVAQYLRLLYAKIGIQHHPDTDRPIQPLTHAQLEQHLENTLRQPAAKKSKKLYLCAPLIRARKGHHQPIATWIANHGYTHMRVDGKIIPVAKFQKLDRYKEHDIDLILTDLNADLRSAKSKERNTKNKKNTDTAAPSDFYASPRPPHSSLSAALRLGNGTAFLLSDKNQILTYLSTTRTDITTGESFPELDPKHFSHNSPKGWCPACRGHGRIYPWMLETAKNPDATDDEKYLLESGLITHDTDLTTHGQPCPACHGARLNRTSRSVKLHLTPDLLTTTTNVAANVSSQATDKLPTNKKPPARTALARAHPTSRGDKSPPHPGAPRPISTLPSPISNLPAAISLPELLALTSSQLLSTLSRLDLTPRTRAIARDIIPQIAERLKFLDHVGLDYLTLDRPTQTLSGGESQRIRLAAQLGTNLAGVLYVLDEPSIGLHARDNDRLIETLEQLRAKGNSLLVVEHDEALMTRADHLIDLGPGAGKHGGQLLAQGTPKQVQRHKNSLTARYLKTPIPHPTRGAYRPV